MAKNPRTEAGPSSEVRNYYLEPLTEVMNQNVITFRSCEVISDQEWIYSGINRLIFSCKSGRDFLQMFSEWSNDSGLMTENYFANLRSERRMKMVMETDETHYLNTDVILSLLLKKGNILRTLGFK